MLSLHEPTAHVGGRKPIQELKMDTVVPLIALAGYARVGKDTAAEALRDIGYHHVSFGSIIKRQLDRLIVENLGFSAFTEKDDEKSRIRNTLQAWGDDNYEAILQEFFRSLPNRAVNSRLVRTREAMEWVKRGGVIVEIRRPGKGPATDWERDRLEELRGSGLIDFSITATTVPELKEKVVQYATGVRAY